MRWLALFLLLIPCLSYGQSRIYNVEVENAYLTESQRECILRDLQIDLDLNAAYVWGADNLEPGKPGDCSGKIWARFFTCGCKVRRVTANWMARGKAGWGDFSPKVPFEEGRRLYLVHLTFSPHRPYGHVGILTSDVVEDHLGRYVATMAHASSSYGFIESTVIKDEDNYYIDKIRYLRATSESRE